MSFRKPFRIALAGAAIALLGACASAPQPLQGTFTPVTPEQAVATTQTGASVRWGGRIVETMTAQASTCFQMIGMPLDATGRPDSDRADASQGRFLACRAGFFDPAIFTPGRDVTFVGSVQGTDMVRIGEYDYQLPKISADVVYLWPVVTEVRVIADPWGPWGYGGPWGPWGGPWGRWGYWGW